MTNLGAILGESVRKLRGGASQSDFAEILGVPLRTYQRYESGERVFPDEVLAKITERFNIEIADLFKGGKILSLPVSGAIKKMSSIPDDFYDLAFKLGDPEAEEWEFARGVLEGAIEKRQENGNANHF